MADYAAWAGLGNALQTGGDAFAKARAARDAATRQAEQDAMAKDVFERQKAEQTPMFDAIAGLAVPPGTKLTRPEVVRGAEKLAEIDARHKGDIEAKRLVTSEKAEAKKIAKRPGEVTVRNLSEGKLLPGELSNVEKLLKENASLFGPVSGRMGAVNPYDEASQRVNSQIKATAQMIGKYMEGGVLRAEDIPKYAAMLPALSDTPEVAQGKINNIRSLLERKYNTDLESLSQGGYDVSGFQPMKFQSPEATGPSAGEVQDGFRFKGGNPSDPNSWEPVQ